MVSLIALWLPVLVSALVVFFISALVWTQLPHHRKDFAKVADEPALMDAVTRSVPGPGMYYFPLELGAAANTPEYTERVRRGPVGILRLRRPEQVLNLPASLFQFFVLTLFISALVALLAAFTLTPAADPMNIFRVTGLAAFLAYGLVGFQDSIWFGLPISVTLKHMLDGLVYALATGGIFTWLWPA